MILFTRVLRPISREDVLSSVRYHLDQGQATLLSGFEMSDMDLSGCDLRDVVFEGCKIVGCRFDRARLVYARFRDSLVHRCSFSKCDLTDTEWRESEVSETSFVGSSLNRSTMNRSFEDCDFSMSDMRDVKAKSYFFGSTFDGAKVTPGSSLLSLLKESQKDKIDFGDPGYPHHSFGHKTASVIKARKSSGKPQGFFERAYPEESRKIKDVTAGRPMKPDVIASVESSCATVDSTGRPLVWILTKGRYEEYQRITDRPNEVIMFNVVMSEDEAKNMASALPLIRRYGHPSEHGKMLTIGWVRYFAQGGSVVIEEVQSDVDVIHKKSKTKDKSDDFWQDIAYETSFFQPHVEAFYYDAVGTIFQLAELEGKSVEMLSYEQKQRFGSPRSVYEDLPRKMGMKPGESSVPEIKGKVWRYTPNRRRR